MLESRREAERRTEEAAQASAALAQAMEALTENNWMLRKVAEVLPTCMFLSHGCCPACTTQMHREMGVPDHEE